MTNAKSLQRKVCMLGAFSVGKTSLVQRFVSSLFSDKYLTTVGVKIDKKVVATNAQDVTLMLWDLAGEDAYHTIKTSYLRGAAGCIIVIDGTRPKTLEVAREIIDLVQKSVGEIPFIIALNKADRKDEWLLESEDIAQLRQAHVVIETSAKSGANVDEMFRSLTEAML